jgi:hypothetical protein
MEAYCVRVDAAGGDAYLETDKPANVRFYERFGFEVIGDQEILGVTNWFMLRQALGGRRAGEAAGGDGLGDAGVAPRGRVPRLLRSRPALGGAAWSSFRGPDGDV